MSAINVALLGYGTVGKGVYSAIRNHQKRFEAMLGKTVKITAVLVKNIEKHQIPDQDVLFTNEFKQILDLPELDVVIDAIVGAEPGFSYLQAAIKRGCHVITANKEMFAHHGPKLLSLAEEHGVSVGFEATVGGGIPVIQTMRTLLNVNRITKMEGIVNGTSNFILTKMREDGISFTEALAVAQDLGYAELDPTNDIEGYDAYYKTMVLSQVAFGEQPEWNDVFRKGITAITAEKIELFSELGLRFKHVVALERTKAGIKASVKPVLVSKSHPLYQVEGVQNAFSIKADIVGNISIQGPGAGMFPTASAVVEDLLQLLKPNFPKQYDDSFDQVEDDAFSPWIITGEGLSKLILPTQIDKLGFLHKNALLVAGDEEYLLNIKGVEYYQVYGRITDLDLLSLISGSEAAFVRIKG